MPSTHGGRRPGAGRKPLTGERLVSVTISLPRRVVEWLDAQDGSRSAIIRRVLDYLSR